MFLDRSDSFEDHEIYDIYHSVPDTVWGRFGESGALAYDGLRLGGRSCDDSVASSSGSSISKPREAREGKFEEEVKSRKDVRRKKKKNARKMGRTLPADGDEIEEDQNVQEAWDKLTKTCPTQNSSEWDELTEEQKCFPSFEAWAAYNEKLCPSTITRSTSGFKLYDSIDYRVQLEEAMCIVQGAGFDYSLLEKKVVIGLFVRMDLESVIACSRTCKRWNEIAKDISLWEEKFERLERQIFADEPDVNIWEEVGADFDGNRDGDAVDELKRASLNALVAAMTSHTVVPDSIDVLTFMASYQTFTTIRQVIRKLLQRYMVPERQYENEEERVKYMAIVVKPIQMRVCKLLRQIVEMRYSELDKDLRDLIKCFIMGKVGQSFLSKRLQMAIRNSTIEENKPSEQPTWQMAKPDIQKKLTTVNILDIPSEEIARQLTLIEFELYSQIKPMEFFGQAWAKPKLHNRAPNIRMIIERFNQVTRWITTEIIREEKIRNRVKRFTKFVKIAQSLRAMNNYHTLMAVLGGLNEGPIYRLKHTRSELPLKVQQTLSELQLLMSADGSYCEYRLALANSAPPCIPYIGVYLRDLTYYEEGSGNSEEGFINFKSKKNVYTTIQIVQRYQVIPYSFKKQERIWNYLKNVSGMSDSELFEMSALREPKNSKRSDLQ